MGRGQRRSALLGKPNRRWHRKRMEASWGQSSSDRWLKIVATPDISLSLGILCIGRAVERELPPMLSTDVKGSSSRGSNVSRCLWAGSDCFSHHFVYVTMPYRSVYDFCIYIFNGFNQNLAILPNYITERNDGREINHCVLRLYINLLHW